MRFLITQHDLRTRTGEIVRCLEQGTSYLVTRDGVPIGELVPLSERHFVGVDEVLAVFAGAPPVDAQLFRRDLDLRLDQSVPRLM